MHTIRTIRPIAGAMVTLGVIGGVSAATAMTTGAAAPETPATLTHTVIDQPQARQFTRLGTTLAPRAVSAADTQSADAAFAGLKRAVTGIGSEAAGPATMEPYLFTNTQYGDGKVYHNTPVWLVSIPLRDQEGLIGEQQYAMEQDCTALPPGVECAKPPTPKARKGCEYRYIVDAKSALAITWWQDCPS